MNTVITDKIELPAGVMNDIEKIGNVSYYPNTQNLSQEILKRIKNADIITANFIDITREIIDNSLKLKYIISPAVGYDWIDVDAARNHGIRVLNCPTFNSDSTAEHAIALMFAVARMIPHANNSILDGTYKSTSFVGTELNNKLLVTFGYGRVGKRVTEIAKGLGMRTAYINTSTVDEDISSLIKSADFLVMCLPLNKETKHIMSQERFSLMKNTSYIINVARGLVIDQNALFEVLKNKKIAGAGIDTFPNDETITELDENIARFVRLNNVVSTPHIAYNTRESSERLGQELIDVIKSCLANKPINVVN